ncbi:MAG: methyltransferase domain-containing protein [Nannocystaceae bacterium]|nr:methyltransferase domain-containing protein [Nannocystaceae bacterium]
MTARFDPDSLDAMADADVAALRDALQRAGYDGECLGSTDAIAYGMPEIQRRPLVLHALTQRGDAGATLTLLFAHGAAVPTAAAEQALGATLLATLRAHGLVRGDASVRAQLRLVPFAGLWFASTPLDARVDPVMGPTATTDELAWALRLQGVERLLDVGTGAGAFALFARSRGVAHVTGVDIDPRAIAFARFNGRLNGLEIEWLQGDLTAPVAGRRFDAVVSQPAYVARPPDAAAVTFLHAGERGDELALRLVAALPSVLDAGGQAWLLFDSPAASLAALARAVADAIEPAPMALCLLSRPGNDAGTQAIAYASVHDRTLGDEYAAEVVRYREHFARLGVTHVRHVLLYAQLRAHAGSLVAFDAGDLAGFDGETLVALLRAADVAALSDAALCEHTVRPHPRARLLHEQSLGPTGVDALHVRFEQGAGVDRSLDDAEATMLLALRDHEPTQAAIATWAQERGLTLDAATRGFLAFVRQGLRTGLLTPA